MQKTNQESIWHNWQIGSFFVWKISVYRERICILRLTKGKRRRLSITAAFFDNWFSTKRDILPPPGNWLNTSPIEDGGYIGQLSVEAGTNC